MNEDNHFKYRYTAPTEAERREIISIRKDYQPVEVISKIDQLRVLDRKARLPAFCFAIALGIIGLMIFGTGMALILNWNRLILGSSIALIGAAMMIFPHPTHKYILTREKNKYSEEIMELSSELLDEFKKNK